MKKYFFSIFTKCAGSLFIFSFVYLVSCCPQSLSYREFYSHLHQKCIDRTVMRESEFFLIILVDACHLDYTDNKSFLYTVAKHPADGTTNGQVGHAWIYLQGSINGEKIVLEGGHSGELGERQCKYFDGIMNYNDYGFANPSIKQRENPIYEANPIKYLWAVQNDGFFQEGSGEHRPTFAAKIDLTEEQFVKIMGFMKYGYPYRQYALTKNQCSSFVAKVAALADFHISYEICMPIDQKIYFGERHVRFWEDPRYSYIRFATPDIVEKSLMKAVHEGTAEYALDWYTNEKYCK